MIVVKCSTDIHGLQRRNTKDFSCSITMRYKFPHVRSWQDTSKVLINFLLACLRLQRVQTENSTLFKKCVKSLIAYQTPNTGIRCFIFCLPDCMVNSRTMLLNFQSNLPEICIMYYLICIYSTIVKDLRTIPLPFFIH